MKLYLLFIAAVLAAVILLPGAVLGASQPTSRALVGKWAGTVSSRGFASFTVTIEIGQDSKAHLVADGSPCVDEADLVVTNQGSNSFTLAGSSKAGESITFKGTIDNSGKQLDLNYITNGSSSARCETDQGSGILDKQ